MTNKVSSVSIQTIHIKRPNYRKLLWTIQYNQDGQNVEMNVLTDENRMPLYSATHLHIFLAVWNRSDTTNISFPNNLLKEDIG
jgi:hypothetical protein